MRLHSGAGLLLLVLGGHLWPINAAAGQAPAAPTISVSGSASAAAAPDEASLRFGVEVQRETAVDALSANNELMNAVVRAVQAAGVSENEISTARLTVHPVYDRRQDPGTGSHSQILSGYRVGNVLDVNTAELDRVATIIDAAVNAGANRVERVAFGLSAHRLQQLQKRLIAAAVEDARERAEEALAALDHHIVGVESVSLTEQLPQPRMFMETARMDAMASAPPVFAGEHDVQVSVQVTFLTGPD